MKLEASGATFSLNFPTLEEGKDRASSCKYKFYMSAPLLLNLLNSLRKSDTMLDKPHILSFSPTRFITFINEIIQEHE